MQTIEELKALKRDMNDILIGLASVLMTMKTDKGKDYMETILSEATSDIRDFKDEVDEAIAELESPTTDVPQKKIVSYEFKLSSTQVEDFINDIISERVNFGSFDYDTELREAVQDIVETYSLHKGIIFDGDPSLYPVETDENVRFDITVDYLIEMVNRRL